MDDPRTNGIFTKMNYFDRDILNADFKEMKAKEHKKKLTHITLKKKLSFSIKI